MLVTWDSWVLSVIFNILVLDWIFYYNSINFVTKKMRQRKKGEKEKKEKRRKEKKGRKEKRRK